MVRATVGARGAVVAAALERLISSMGGGSGGADCGRDSSLIGGRAGAGSGRDSSLIGGRAGAGSERDATRLGGSARTMGLAGLETGFGTAGGREAMLGAGFARATGLDELLSRGAGLVWTVAGERCAGFGVAGADVGGVGFAICGTVVGEAGGRSTTAGRSTGAGRALVSGRSTAAGRSAATAGAGAGLAGLGLVAGLL